MHHGTPAQAVEALGRKLAGVGDAPDGAGEMASEQDRLSSGGILFIGRLQEQFLKAYAQTLHIEACLNGLKGGRTLRFRSEYATEQESSIINNELDRLARSNKFLNAYQKGNALRRESEKLSNILTDPDYLEKEVESLLNKSE